MKIISGRLQDTLCHFRDSLLTGSPNRCISDFANAPSKFLASLGTSDMPRTLYVIKIEPNKSSKILNKKSKSGNILKIYAFFTIIAMQGIIIYRQFAFGQNISVFEDIAIIITINSIFLISVLLYFGALPISKLKVKSIVLIYLALVVLGTAFTYAKYNLFQSPGLSFEQLLDKLKIITAIIGLLMGFWILLPFIGKKRLDKE